jgi:hypothetical protein
MSMDHQAAIDLSGLLYSGNTDELREANERLCTKCRRERMSRTAVLQEWGDPRTWTSIDGVSPTTVREFINELGNRIRITIEGPTSTGENILTPMEVSELRQALNAHGVAPAHGIKLWQTVPKEPTREMCLAAAEAAREYMEQTGGNSPVVIYRAMLAAAPVAGVPERVTAADPQRNEGGA